MEILILIPIVIIGFFFGYGIIAFLRDVFCNDY